MKNLNLIFIILLFCCNMVHAANILDFGAIGDGDPAKDIDNYNSFKLALDSADVVFFPSGTYYIKAGPTYGLILKSGARVYGEGKGRTKLIFTSSTASHTVIFYINNQGVSFDNLSIKLEGIGGDSVHIFTLRSDNFTLSQSEIDGGNTAQNRNIVQAFAFSNIDTKNIRIQNNDIHNVQRVILRTNDMVGRIENVSVTNNFIHDLGQGGVQFNTPKAPAKDIIISGNHFANFHSGTEQIFVGLASGQNVVISDNTFSGKAKNCIHLEENSDNISITGNACNANAIGVFINDNSVSGEANHPDYITIVGNTFFDASLMRKNHGIYATANSTNISAFSNLIIQGNTFKGYRYAVALDNDAYIISDNFFINSDYCIRLQATELPTISNNLFRNCSQDIYSITNNPPNI